MQDLAYMAYVDLASAYDLNMYCTLLHLCTVQCTVHKCPCRWSYDDHFRESFCKIYFPLNKNWTCFNASLFLKIAFTKVSRLKFYFLLYKQPSAMF